MTSHGANVPLLKLNNGVEMPALGFGVFQTPPEETVAAVEAALATGYRHHPGDPHPGRPRFQPAPRRVAAR